MIVRNPVSAIWNIVPRPLRARHENQAKHEARRDIPTRCEARHDIVTRDLALSQYPFPRDFVVEYRASYRVSQESRVSFRVSRQNIAPRFVFRRILVSRVQRSRLDMRSETRNETRNAKRYTILYRSNIARISYLAVIVQTTRHETRNDTRESCETRSEARYSTTKYRPILACRIR